MTAELGTSLATVETQGIVEYEGESEVGRLLRLGMEQRVDVGTLERLMALYERTQAMQAKRAYDAAMAAFQAECPAPRRTQATQFVQTVGTRTRGMYAPLDEIQRACRPSATKHGLSWSWDQVTRDGMLATTCTLRHVMGHVETATVSIPLSEPNKAQAQAQAYQSTNTYGMRYSLMSVLGIAAEDDVDGAEPVADTLGAVQLAEIRSLFDAAVAAGMDATKFYTHVGVETLAELPASRYTEIAGILRRRGGAS